MAEKKERPKEPWVECFSYYHGRCLYIDKIPPKDCKGCRFKKPVREVTNGVRYEPAQEKGYVSKYEKGSK